MKTQKHIKTAQWLRKSRYKLEMNQTQLAKQLGINRWLILNRLRKIQKKSKKRLGKPIIEYYAGLRSGKKRAWWIGRELAET